VALAGNGPAHFRENNSFICTRLIFISSSTKNHGFRGMIFMQPKNPTRRTFFPMRVDTLRPLVTNGSEKIDQFDLD
jgi:hypothetical protein